MAQLSKIGFDSIYSFPVLLPRYYGGVILVGVGSFAVHLFLGGRVMKARRAIDFPAPNMYHPTNMEFNCIQRAHQNYLENIPFFLSGLFIGGLYCPVGATFLGSVYLFGRICYYKGYISGDPSKRRRGMVGMMALMLLMLVNTFFGSAHLYASIRLLYVFSVSDSQVVVQC
ncbi:unnamed protein product [Hymenolepis diminuta]|uniref:Microsomal glutathione S-transferase 3 n=1 Tax=Hymenolepis diminuta TaxID=6216 RepID=A0A564Y6F3_HYMDI|nr:unnamed protein product [Hymenolepis diminuta]